jgi:hypothetical protein
MIKKVRLDRLRQITKERSTRTQRPVEEVKAGGPEQGEQRDAHETLPGLATKRPRTPAGPDLS